MPHEPDQEHPQQLLQQQLPQPVDASARGRQSRSRTPDAVRVGRPQSGTGERRMSTGDVHGRLARLDAWLQLVRVPTLFTAWSNVIAAHLIATLGSPHWRLLALQLAIATCLYWASMILNDCFDLGRDRVAHPERPLPSGRIAPRAAWAAGFGLLAAGVVLGLLAGPGPFVLTLLLAAVILAYVGGIKHRGPGPLLLALARWLNWLLGLSAGLVLIPELLLALPVLLYTLAFAVLHRAGTAPSSRGVRRAVVVLGLALAAALALYPLGILTDPYAVALTALGGALLLRRLLRLKQDPTRARVRASVAFMLLCSIALDALLLAGDGQRLAAALLLTLLVPVWLLGYRVPPT
ncbi:UbiA family prenyltransferase [Thiohalocapsa sp. ML1]|uniref:UbiA family prenyltransferase n=1 Tax=Thiohalocapsa sp. ML1 TaxID=1431688 RepID=UPI0007322F37|nr:UbiA family prenyltransferase [Thiohalocapsa sp. ML1]